MYKNKTFLAVIPARGGSKGLPKKNIKELCGKPLIAWSIETALESKFLDEVVVTTDSKKIAKISKDFGANVPFLRPDHLATDTATTFDTVKHTLDFYSNRLKKEFDYVVLLEPTSPLRENTDIDTMIERLIRNESCFDSIMSIGEVREHPSIARRISHNNFLVGFCRELSISTRRQDNETAYFPYGVAYIAKTILFLKEKTFYLNRNYFYKIKRYQCYEIDDIYDFISVQNIMKYEWGL